MKTKTNLSQTNPRQECGAEAPQYGHLLSPCTGDAPQKEKILRPECGAEAPTFLSAVYKRGTQAKKRQAYAPQYGRSMIEMLGVLAIIGVLTVGSITAYSKAMQRHLLNRQAEQISYILSAAETNRDLVENYHRMNYYNMVEAFKTFGWVSEDMIKDNSGDIYDAFNNRISIIAGPSYTTCDIKLANKDTYEQCVNLYQTAKRFSSFIYHIAVITSKGTSVDFGNVLAKATLTEISQRCNACKDVNSCTVRIGFWRFI